MSTINDITPNLGLALPHPANDADVDIIRLRNMIQTLDSAIPALLTNAMGNVLTSLHTELQTVINALGTVAPSDSALSTAQWSNARAALLDRLDAAVGSRAPAASALSSAVWTQAHADRILALPTDPGVQKFRPFTSSGVFVCPKPYTQVVVLVIGGGQGGQDGGAGGTSSFGSLVTAQGGTNGWEVGESATSGGNGPYGFGNGGAGGNGFQGNYSRGGAPGNHAVYVGTISADQVVTVGVGGTSTNGKPGRPGAVLVWYI